MTKKQNPHKDNVTSIYPNTQHANLKKSLRRKRWHDYVVNGSILIMVIFGMLCIAQIVQAKVEISDLNSRVTSAQDTLTSEKKAVNALQKQANLLKNDEYVAKLARSRYYLSKEDEIIFSVPEDNDSKQAEILNEIYLNQQAKAEAKANSQSSSENQGG